MMACVLKMNNGVNHEFAALEYALEWALNWEGIHSHYECSDGRVYLYRDDEERDADWNGAVGERGVIFVEEVAE